MGALGVFSLKIFEVCKTVNICLNGLIYTERGQIISHAQSSPFYANKPKYRISAVTRRLMYNGGAQCDGVCVYKSARAKYDAGKLGSTFIRHNHLKNCP